MLVEAPGVARSEADAPEVDARVFVPKSLPVGEFAEVTVVAANEYDLVAQMKAREKAVTKLPNFPNELINSKEM